MFAIWKSSRWKFPQWLVSGSVIALCLIAWSGPARAYRPFDGTDAAVAAPGELEIELQPAGRLREGGNTTLVAPATVFNFGLSEGWEAVFEGQGQTPLSPSGPTSLTAAGAFLKHVLQPGSLQDKTGPSVATEFGVLLPDSTGSSGVGASLAGIVSQRWDWGTIHLNAETALTREHHADRVSWRHHRRTVKMVDPAGRRVFLRKRIWQSGNDIRFDRSDLESPR